MSVLHAAATEHGRIVIVPGYTRCYANCKSPRRIVKADTLRVLSLGLAVATLLAAGLAFEALHRAERPQGAGDGSPAVPSQPPAPPPAAPIPERQAERRPAPPQPVRAAINKCSVAGQTVYSDQPCSAGAGSELRLPGDSAGLAPRRSYQQQLADIEPARRQRIERERRYDDERRSLAAAVPDKTRECADIDRAVAGIDAILRQPYGPEFGDRKKAERKALMDRRFSIGC